MTISLWVLGLTIYIACICLLGEVLGFNKLDGETEPVGWVRRLALTDLRDQVRQISNHECSKRHGISRLDKSVVVIERHQRLCPSISPSG